VIYMFSGCIDIQISMVGVSTGNCIVLYVTRLLRRAPECLYDLCEDL